MNRRSIIASLFAMLLAPLGLRKEDEVPGLKFVDFNGPTDHVILDGPKGLVRFFLKDGPRDIEIPLANWLKNRPGESPLLRDWAYYSARKFRRQGLYG